ncbi:asparaginase [soil metagenome]
MRDGATDALHVGHVAVVDVAGRVIAAHGDPSVVTYPRSALKPFQAAAALQLLADHPPADEIAIMAASHVGTRTHQAAVVRVLDRAGLTAGALGCPPALPTDPAALLERPEPTPLAHSCSGKHAGFLLAAVTAGAGPEDYLDEDHPVQRAVWSLLRTATATQPSGPGVDGCGAPAWRVPLMALARAFATATADHAELGAVAAAMQTHPLLIAGHDVVDTELMRAEPAIVAKRGAEGTLAFAAPSPAGPVGVAIKVSDGAMRAVGPVAVAILQRLGLRATPALRRPVVLGGGVAHGAIEVAPELQRSLADLSRSLH